MEKKIFILSGAGNTGKTTTFNFLFKKLSRKYSGYLIYFKRNSNRPEDFCAVFKNDGVVIGLYSAGDSAEEVNRNLDSLVKYKCDYIFGASRTKGSSCDAIIQYAQSKYGSADVIEWIEKVREEGSDEQHIVNKEAAKILYRKFKQILEAE